VQQRRVRPRRRETLALRHYMLRAAVARRLASQHGQPRTWPTEFMNLLLLALDIRAEVLPLKYPADRKPITERTLRRLLERVVWEEQRALWAELRAVAR
jgi:hypothetical protein